MFKRRGKVFVVSGPSGVGKGSLVKEVMKLRQMHLSISYTSREPRHNEEKSKNYHFISKDEFKRMLSENAFAEHAKVYGNYYGTPKAELEEILSSGRDVLLEIEMKGAGQIKKMGQDAVLIFILPPNLEVLAQRLRSRATETEEAVAQRLGATMAELKHLCDYDYFLVNRDLKKTAEELNAIIEAQRHRISPELIDYLERLERNFSL